MTSTSAQIAALVSRRNHLASPLTEGFVLDHFHQYRMDMAEDSTVTACVRARMLNWCVGEVSHLSVLESHEGRGIATNLVMRSVQTLRDGGARVVLCTIVQSNRRSIRCFEAQGFVRTALIPGASGRPLGLYQRLV